MLFAATRKCRIAVWIELGRVAKSAVRLALSNFLRSALVLPVKDTDGMMKVFKGVTSVNEIVRVTT
jgi:hypothetical protein